MKHFFIQTFMVLTRIQSLNEKSVSAVTINHCHGVFLQENDKLRMGKFLVSWAICPYYLSCVVGGSACSSSSESGIAVFILFHFTLCVLFLQTYFLQVCFYSLSRFWPSSCSGPRSYQYHCLTRYIAICSSLWRAQISLYSLSSDKLYRLITPFSRSLSLTAQLSRPLDCPVCNSVEAPHVQTPNQHFSFHRACTCFIFFLFIGSHSEARIAVGRIVMQ